MTKVIVHTHLPAAAKITLELKGRITFKPVGQVEGVPPGVQIEDDDHPALYMAAQDFGIIIVDDERLVSVEASAVKDATSATDKKDD